MKQKPKMNNQILVACLIMFLDLVVADPSFTFTEAIPLSSSSSARRDIRIVAGNSASWVYQACVADSFSNGQINTLFIYSNTSQVIPGTAPSSGVNNYDLTVVQGFNDCAYAGLVNSQLVNVVAKETSVTLPTADWQSPFYAVWLNNQVQTFLYRGLDVVNYLNLTAGTYRYQAIDNSMELIKAWELYQHPTTQISYIVYSLGRTDTEVWKSVVHKCNPDCAADSTIDVSAYSTITANSTHWFVCYKQVMSSGQVIQSGTHFCTTAGLPPLGWIIDQADVDYPIQPTTGEDRMYSCMMGETTMILAVYSSDNFKYNLYSLDTLIRFNVTSKSAQRDGTLMSMACKDRVILVALQGQIDYWVWDDGTGFLFPPISGPSSLNPPVDPPVTPPVAAPITAPTAVPVNAPVVISTPTLVPTSGVKQNTTAATGDLTEDQKILIGVLVGVGVPVLSGAVVLIVLRKRLVRKKSDEEDSVYTAIDVLSKDDPLFEKKMLIPFKQLSFTKEIGSGSFGKVFLGKWRGATVAIKMNNQIADTEGFLAEARLTLSMPPHPNLVQTYGVSMDSDYPYIVLEYCEGGSLDRIVFTEAIKRKEQRALVLGIAYGLMHLHAHKIVHRDLAVRNILLKESRAKISDFGMSRVLKEEATQGKTNTTVGPIRWMAPESINDLSYSTKSDVWTFGVVVSEIVNGQEPHFGENQIDVAMKIRDQGYTPALPDDCDPVLKELMQMCWKYNPDDRPDMNTIIQFLNDKFAQP